METNIERNKKAFLELYNEKIKREGASELLKYLCGSDFFTAPASSRFHSNFEGGLCAHSLNVYRRLDELVRMHEAAGDIQPGSISEESVAVCGLLHDLCKVNFYKISFRNVKVDGAWEQVPFYTVEDSLPYGHGEKSVYIISGFMRLTREEAMAINWHMGGFDKRVLGGEYAISQAFEEYPFATMIHLADVMATYFDEEK